MATRAFTKVSIAGSNYPMPIGPFSIQIYRLQGGTVGDTITIPASNAGGRIIAGAISGSESTTDLSTQGDTQVVFTMVASTVPTNATVDALLFVQS